MNRINFSNVLTPCVYILPQGFMINDGAEYAFVRNLQGDVIAMVDQNGKNVMEYSYDPWGKIEYHLNDESLTEEDAALITALCPLTYRGYNYDFTTGLYYLQSRYYNPEWGRFLNCDDTNILLATQGETHNANLFAYCANNPVNDIDPTGMAPKFSSADDIGDWVGSLMGILALFGAVIQNEATLLKIFDVKISLKEETFGLIYLKINLLENDFYQNLSYAVSINKEITYQLLALLSDEAITKKANRQFLFSIDCMIYEIQWHVDRFIVSKMLPPNTGVLGTGVTGAIKSYLYRHCKTIDIYENDVEDLKQATRFDYNGGIRSCYYHTDADPYMTKLGIRNNLALTAVKNTNWKKELGKKTSFNL